MSETPRDFEFPTPAPNADNQLPSPPPTAKPPIVPPRREGTTLSTGLLAVGVCAVLMGLVQTVESTIAPASWSANGGAGASTIGVFGALAVRQTYQLQQQIEQLLAALRAASR